MDGTATATDRNTRIVPNFLVQTGDRTGTGAGGESFYGGTSKFNSE